MVKGQYTVRPRWESKKKSGCLCPPMEELLMVGELMYPLCGIFSRIRRFKYEDHYVLQYTMCDVCRKWDGFPSEANVERILDRFGQFDRVIFGEGVGGDHLKELARTEALQRAWKASDSHSDDPEEAKRELREGTAVMWISTKKSGP